MFVRSADYRNRLLFAADDGGGQGGETEPGKGTGGADEEKPRTFTQADVDRIATREARTAERRAAEKLTEQLGVSLEDAKAIIEARNKAETEKLTDADKAKRAADEALAEAQKAKAEAARERHEAKVERLLGAAGVDEKVLSKASRLLDIEPGAEADEIREAIEALKADVPGLFTAQPASNNGTGTPSGSGGPKPPASQGTASGLDRGRAAYEARHQKK